MSNRDVVVKRLVSTINQLNGWVDVVFPELRQVFKDISAKGQSPHFVYFHPQWNFMMLFQVGNQ